MKTTDTETLRNLSLEHVEWASKRGALIQDATEHATRLTEEVKSAVRSPGPHGADIAVTRVLEAALKVAHAAGVREGECRADRAAHRALARYKEALLSVGLPPAECPHCIKGRGPRSDCKLCGGTGKVI